MLARATVRERDMNTLLRFVIAVAASFSVIAAQAMPYSSNKTHDSLVIGVAGGCGPGFHRGPYGAVVVMATTVAHTTAADTTAGLQQCQV
jgi:hypothetical protein